MNKRVGFKAICERQMNKRLVICLGIYLLGVFSAAWAQCARTADFRTWIQEGNSLMGNWDVDNSGTSVLQKVHATVKPSFFVGPDSLAHVQVKGKLRINSAISGITDDDWVGIVLGYHSPNGDQDQYETWLFDWKRSDELWAGYQGLEGRNFSKINGLLQGSEIPTHFFQHDSDPEFDVIASDFGPGKGWEPDRDYNLTINYSPTRCVIIVNLDTIFDVQDCFPAGRIGFYTYSQANVEFRDFTFQRYAFFETLTPEVCVGEDAEFEAVSITCAAASNAAVSSWEWSFGDGGTATQINPKHSYATPDLYSVRLVLWDTLGCQDTFMRSVRVLDVPDPNLGADTALCETDGILLSPDLPGQNQYLWNDGSTDSSKSVTTNGIYWVDATNRCGKNRDSISVVFAALPEPVDLGPDTAICEGTSLTLNAFQPSSTFMWQDFSDQSTYEVTTAGNYWVEVLHPCGLLVDNIQVSVIPSEILPTNLGRDTLLCEGESLQLDVSQPYVSYRWQDGNDDAVYDVSTGGTFHVWVGNVCDWNTDTLEVEYYNYPKPFELGTDTTICIEDRTLFLLDASQEGQGLTYYWQDGTEDAYYWVENPGHYEVAISNVCGSESNHIEVASIDCDCTVFMGNAFTPNGDGHNDSFGPRSECGLLDFYLVIFNRWGKPVYESYQPDLGWDGTHNGVSCPEGVYLWQMTYRASEGGDPFKISQNGSVTVFR